MRVVLEIIAVAAGVACCAGLFYAGVRFVAEATFGTADTAVATPSPAGSLAHRGAASCLGRESDTAAGISAKAAGRGNLSSLRVGNGPAIDSKQSGGASPEAQF